MRFDSVHHIRDHFCIQCDIFSDQSVSPGFRQCKSPSLITQGHGKPVYLFFHGKSRIGMLRKNALYPCFYILFGKNILDRKHRYTMGHFHACFPLRRTTDLLRRRILCHPIRMCLFHLFQFAHQRIIFKVADLRLILVIIKVHMMIYGLF